MRRRLKRTLAVSTLLALVSSSAAGWAVAFHSATEDHHGGGSSHHGLVGLDMVLHGHAHGEGTPAHGHPLLTSVAAPMPGKLLLLMGSMIGDAPGRVASATSGRHLLLQSGPTHDPPGGLEAVSVLRI